MTASARQRADARNLMLERSIKMDATTLDNKTIAKLAIAIAITMKKENEGIGPLTGIVLDTLDNIDSLEHFVSYRQRG
jgi:hypothetical protein